MDLPDVHDDEIITGKMKSKVYFSLFIIINFSYENYKEYKPFSSKLYRNEWFIFCFTYFFS
jgi:hypothetical protein